MKNYIIGKKKIIHGTSDAWSMSRLSHRPSDPVYYIEDCRISVLAQSLAEYALKDSKEHLSSLGNLCIRLQLSFRKKWPFID